MAKIANAPDQQQHARHILLVGDRRRCRRRSSSGRTRPLQTMIASATESTITIAVAADSPPTKGEQRDGISRRATAAARARTCRLSKLCPWQVSRPADGDRHDENVDQHQIDRKQPCGAADLASRSCSRRPSHGTGAAAAGCTPTTRNVTVSQCRHGSRRRTGR